MQSSCNSSVNITQANGVADAELLPSAGPTHFAHCDHHRDGVLPVLQENLPVEEFEKWSKGDWAVMNVREWRHPGVCAVTDNAHQIWRPVERDVTREPLAMLDARTVAPEDFEAVTISLPDPSSGKAFDKIYTASKGFDIAQIRASDRHRWYYISDLAPDEALVFKQYDSRTDGRARQTPHSAIESVRDHGPARQSIEFRCLLRY
jgi:hypothetical protein